MPPSQVHLMPQTPLRRQEKMSAAIFGQTNRMPVSLFEHARGLSSMSKSQRKKEGQYVPLPYSFLHSPAWRSLSGPALKVWLELHTRFNGGNNGKLTLSLNEACSLLGLGKSTAQRAFHELQEKGFIVLMKPGSWYHRQAHEWRLTTKPMQLASGKQLATNDWYDWKPKKTESGPETDPSASCVVPFGDRRRRTGSA